MLGSFRTNGVALLTILYALAHLLMHDTLQGLVVALGLHLASSGSVQSDGQLASSLELLKTL